MDPEGSRDEFGDNIRWGVRCGVLLAVYAATIWLISLAIGGETQFRTTVASPITLVAVYGLVGVLGGMALGLMRPALRRWPGRLLAGFVVTAVAMTPIIRFLIAPFASWGEILAAAVMGSAIVGPIFAFVFWAVIRLVD